jgi:hypothetical protein
MIGYAVCQNVSPVALHPRQVHGFSARRVTVTFAHAYTHITYTCVCPTAFPLRRTLWPIYRPFKVGTSAHEITRGAYLLLDPLLHGGGVAPTVHVPYGRALSLWEAGGKRTVMYTSVCV